MNTLENTAIIIRGVTYDVNQIKECFKDYSNNIIFSTWKGNESKFKLEDKVVYSEQPVIDGPSSFILQRTTSLAGLEFASKLNYQNVILVRFDTFFKPANKVIELFNFNKLNFLCWHNHGIGYFVDYIMAGKIDHIKTLWSTFGVYPSDVSEHIITSNYAHKIPENVAVKFILNDLNDECDIFWKKYNLMLSKYQYHPPYNTMPNGIALEDRKIFLNYIK